MSEIPFHQTRLGKTYYEHTLPRLLELLERIAAALERLEKPEDLRRPENMGEAVKSDSVVD